MAVQALGENILSPEAGGTENLFDTFNGLVKYSYKWEHQGYVSRRAFQAQALSLYTNLASISMLALTASINEKTEKGESTAVDEGKLDSLKAQIQQIDQLAEDYTVTERSADERYYQYPGHERLLKTVAVDRTLNPTYPDHPDYWITKSDLENRVLNYDGNEYLYPKPDWFKDVYMDYNGEKDLNEIFFSADEGNMTAPAGVALNSDTIYLTNQHHEDTYEMSLEHRYSSRVEYFITKAMNNGTTADLWIGNVILYGSAAGGINDWNNVQMLAVIDITGLSVVTPSDLPIPAITGMAESYTETDGQDIVLSIEDQGDLYGYQWEVDKQDGSGFTPIIDADETSYTVGSPTESMNGYQYRCVVTKYTISGSTDSVTTDSVTLNVTNDAGSDASTDNTSIDNTSTDNTSINSTNTDNPHTGDSFPISLILVFLTAGAIILCIVLSEKHKRKSSV